ncbi:MAG: hypothetical protein HYX47_21775 [Burkholderiales bacterium]|nr:hypothetical protein [Burkholderiales bacterium]
MSEQEDQGLKEAAVPLFDIVVRMPPGARLEDVARLAQAAGVPAERVEKLVTVLRSVPQAKIGASVPRDRADRAREQFGKAGLIVEITPVLTVQHMVTGAFDGMHECPGCKTRVVLPENRQCPNCGVFVDKVTDDVLLRRKIMEQEKSQMDFRSARDAKDTEKRIRESLEASIRAKVRAELEEKYGGKKGGFLGRFAGAARIAGAGLLVAVAFLGGKGTTASGFSWSEATNWGPFKSANGSKTADTGKILDAAGAAGAAGAGAKGAAGGGTATAEAGSTGDVDIDDPLIQAAGGKRIGAKGLTIEQAVGAAQALGKAVGNNTIDRAMNGGGPAGPAGAGGAGAGGAGAGGSAGGSAGGGAVAGGPADGTAGGAAGAEAPPQLKALLSLEFAKQLAEMGQVPRAMEIMRALKGSPKVTGDAAVASAARIADLEIKAWATQAQGEARAKQVAEGLMAEAGALSDAAERTQALVRVGVILSRSGRLPFETVRSFFTAASESLKAVSDQRVAAATLSDWAVGLGEALMAEATNRARTGAWAKAQAAGGQVEGLAKQLSDASSQARLAAIDYQVKQQLGQQDKSTQSMETALKQVAKAGGLAERAALLRAVGQLSGGAATEKMQAAATELGAQLASKTGTEKARGLAQLSLLYADAGLRGKSSEFSKMAQSSSGLSPADSASVNADLIVRSDLASARNLQSVGLYAECEAVLQRLAGYLL